MMREGKLKVSLLESGLTVAKIKPDSRRLTNESTTKARSLRHCDYFFTQDTASTVSLQVVACREDHPFKRNDGFPENATVASHSMASVTSLWPLLFSLGTIGSPATIGGHS